MPFDSMPQGKPWGEPWLPQCKSCRQPIANNEPVENLRFDNFSDHKLAELSGAYHAACAKPFMSLARALKMMSSRPF
ncbi:hypothetical protein D3876_11600 [Sphingomonas cavernae]|uniref:Uncharacterized protein n=1 Tax=Sphingomonas cavernae TaxID=2320861 RepID=A0A418WLD8_9SPHN|nr:hypothetical protein D3876_11600 [Sphingomonas cavernae]